MIAVSIIMAANIALRSPSHSDRLFDPIEQAVLRELNHARTDPVSFALSLRKEIANYHGNLLTSPRTNETFLTQEGAGLVDEAARFVGRESAETPLETAPVLAAAALDHQVDQRGSGLVGHTGQDGSTPADRVRRHGGDIYVGEVIAYGTTDPADIVRQLIVDDGVADRGHRRLIYDASLRYAGVSCGPHPVYRYMCVVTLGRTPDGQPLHPDVTRQS